MKAMVRYGIMPRIPISVTPELMEKIEKLLTMVKDAKKVEIDTEKYHAKAWVYDPGNGKFAVGIQIEEG